MFVVKIEGIISNRISVFNPHADIKCFFDGIVTKRLSPGMGFGVLILQTLDGYVRIYLSRSEGTVPQHLLNASQIRPCIQHMSRKGMPQLVWRYVGRKVSGRKPFFHSAFRFSR